MFSAAHHGHQAINHVINVAEAPALRSVPVNDQRLVSHNLFDEVRNDTTIINIHIRPIGVENSHNFEVHIELLSVLIDE